MSKGSSRGRKPSPRVLVGGSSISSNALSHERICKRWTDTPGAVLWTVSLQSTDGNRMRLWTLEGALWCTTEMDLNLYDLPLVIIACFVLHNFCELNNKAVGQPNVDAAVRYERDFQPPTQQISRRPTECNESEGRRIRHVLTKYLDP